MDKRAGLRQYYQAEAEKRTADDNFAQRTAQLNALEETLISAFNTLIRFMDGKTTKTEVVNQLKSIATPDVAKVVAAVEKLDADMLANKVDMKPVIDAMNGVKRELSLIPKTHPTFEQKESVKVTNLSEIKLDTVPLEKAIKNLKLNPTIDVKSPVVNVDAPDLSPLKNVMLDLLQAVKAQKFDIPAFPTIPETDLSKVEKKLDESNKHLKAIADKKGNSGGGGNGTPYIDADGKPLNVILDDGLVPIRVDSDTTSALEEIQSAIQSIASTRGIAGDIRVTLLSGTVSTVTNLQQAGGQPANQLIPSNQNLIAVLGNINNIGA